MLRRQYCGSLDLKPPQHLLLCCMQNIFFPLQSLFYFSCFYINLHMIFLSSMSLVSSQSQRYGLFWSFCMCHNLLLFSGVTRICILYCIIFSLVNDPFKIHPFLSKWATGWLQEAILSINPSVQNGRLGSCEKQNCPQTYYFGTLITKR